MNRGKLCFVWVILREEMPCVSMSEFPTVIRIPEVCSEQNLVYL
jgi:hypothetical protein